MTFDLSTLMLIMRQIVADMPYVAGRQANTFFFLTDLPSLDHPAFGAAYQDYLSGEFYARSWVNQGADQENFKGEHPVLFMENSMSEVQDLYAKDYLGTVSFMLLDRVQCEACPENEVRTPAMISSNVQSMLRNILAELTRYRLYEVVRMDGETEVVTMEWMTVERRLADDTIGASMEVQDMQTYIEPDVIRFQRWGSLALSGLKDRIGYWVQVRFSFCDLLDAEFEYTPIVPGLATTGCAC